ncbi:hypothetical protein ABFS82_07G031500 [Erythranthe guttata]|uniref:CMP/dCMP-type deaminase domain-containing protein n=1 Tax=Erythranthe guttata TaxID=4155 RepID=A0A022RNZ9_ERYGU|nr:PREDICTED: probable inactive tRNA-specific adenosine deaminase-like protein 3 [Erythranthe guttata]EYU41488.1 hypothetical protein MIMGU_mgv1a007509mg [Erythranthe guttata]|eukprot:XP_012832439.1 PREDICTED: probable inactive tRNA-specific adenosine deaminase-like protein 3 [Erythranthe guttata]
MNCSTDETATVSSECWKIIHIPEKDPVLPHLQTTVDVLASTVEPKHANTIMKKLSHIAPLEDLRHVRRIRKTCLDEGKYQLSVILCVAFGNDGEPNCMPEDLVELVNTYQLSTFTTKVCKYAPLTKEEWQEQCKLWPTSFHPPTYNIDGITGFSEEDSLSVFNYMKLAVHMAKSGISVVNAAVIVDPLTRLVIASSCDQVLSCNALSDSTKMDKDSILLSRCSTNEANESFKNVSCLYPLEWIEQKPHLNYNNGYWHPLRHAAIVAIEKSAARDRLLFPMNGQGAELAREEDYIVSSPTWSPSKRQKIDSIVKDDEARMNNHTNGLHCDSTKPYLCTGYDIYFVWEPCTMCAMAIVHQRVKRVFYAFPNPNDGALGSVHRLQGERSLNHHYAVFRVLLPQDILKN